MKTKVAAWMATVFGLGLIGVLFSGQIVRATQQQDSSGSVQELRERIGKLEADVASMQKQLKNLESRRVLTISGSQLPQGSQMPPGSKPYKFNGQTYWFVPLSSDKANLNKLP